MDLLNNKLEKVMKSSDLDFWERYETYDVDGETDSKRKIYDDLEVPVSVFQQSILDTTNLIEWRD